MGIRPASIQNGGHGFVPKETHRPVQTADLLAWHGVQDYKRWKLGDDRRKDYVELLRGQQEQYRFVHGQKDMFDALVDLADFAILLNGLDL
jgi:hypothetical protein